MAIFSNVEHLKIWVHKILPLVYDDSMSYYETLCKVVAKLNEVVTLSNEQTDYLNNWLTTTEESLERWKDDTETSLENKINTDLGAAIDRLETEFADELLDAEGMIYGTQNDVPVEEGSEYYQNNAEYFKERASASAIESRAYANGENASPLFTNNNSKYFRERSEAWAVGQVNGTDVPDTDDAYENNAKYYAEQAREAALTFVPDPTLSEAGRPAEAKATGDADAKLKNEIDEISEDINYTSVTGGISRTVVDMTIATDNNELVIYGTPSGTRYIGFLNGQNFAKGSSDPFIKTLSAGTYKIDFQLSKALTANMEGTYSTFENKFQIIGTTDTSLRSKTYTFTDDVMIAFHATSGRDYGTSEDPTRISFRAYKVSADDWVARAKNDEIDNKIDEKFDEATQAIDATNERIDDIYGQKEYGTIDGKTTVTLTPNTKIESFVIHAVGEWQGEGEPSVSNVRPITNVRNTNLYYSGVDTSDPEIIPITARVTNFGTLYDGDIYPTEGKTVVRKMCKTFDGTESWNVIGSGNKMMFRFNMARFLTYSLSSDINFSSHFNLAGLNTSNTLTGWRAYNSGTYGYIEVRPGTDIATSETTWKAWLAAQYANNTPVQFVVEVLTPETATTSRYNIPSATGVNNYWSDGGDISVGILSGEFMWLKNALHVIDFEAQSGQTSNNGTITESSALTTGVLDVSDYNTVRVYGDKNYRYIVRQGKLRTELRLTITYLYGNFEIDTSTDDFLAINMYKYNEVDGTVIPWDVGEWQRNVILLGNNTVSDYKYDVPESFGAANVVRKAHQMCDITFTAEDDIPFANGDTLSGTVCTGVPYSSVWLRGNNFVPQNCSFHTFMTAAKDPNSYFYTELGGGDERRPYYGTVCSVTSSYLLGIRGLSTTWSMHLVEGLEQLPIQDPQALKIGDLLNRAQHHSVVVTGILRDQNGLIISAELSEAWKNYARRRWLPLTGGAASTGDNGYDLTSYFDSNHGFIAYRYKYLDYNNYSPTPWVHVYDEKGVPVYATTMCPKKGDKSIWSTDEDVIIDIMSETASTGTLSDGTTSSIITISGDTVNLGTLSAGYYTFTVGNESVYFLVANESHTVSISGNQVTVTFTKNALAPFNVSIDSTVNHGVQNFHVLTPEEIAAGVVTVETTPGEHSISVMYESDYGWYVDGFVDITIE